MVVLRASQGDVIGAATRMLAVLRLRVERGTRRRSTARPHRYASPLVGGRREDAVSEFSSRNAIMVGGQRVTCGAVIHRSAVRAIRWGFGRGFKSRARNHLSAKWPIEFSFEIVT